MACVFGRGRWAFVVFSYQGVRFGAFLAFIPVVTLMFVVAVGFEESYCWGRGSQAEKESGTGMREVPPEIADKYALYMGTEPQHKSATLGVAFMAHMDCHETFSWREALLDAIKNPRF